MAGTRGAPSASTSGGGVTPRDGKVPEFSKDQQRNKTSNVSSGQEPPNLTDLSGFRRWKRVEVCSANKISMEPEVHGTYYLSKKALYKC